MFFCELCEIFKNTFFASDCFSKYESLYIIATIHSCLIKSCYGNVRTISRNISVLDCNFQETSSVKLKDWLDSHNDQNKLPQNLENKLTGLHFSKTSLSGLIRRGAGLFREILFHELKIH